ncbi:YdcF family protein [Paracraurococcus lichenis]|uniref:YdcF family protein n=1 Tax=Paracraurococcus lichenis TaxID=3064888 RepID=A0ABT9DYG6_9PROT|nr:YdcF family protein [Paracraurococcus sp. LOR1-02]MDO9708943.1 YdcF family protein [Paracraurococcus sp. LOR1-02]
MSGPAAAAPARPRRQGLRRWLPLLPALALLAFAGGFAWFLMLAAAGPAEPEAPTDGIAVLTGGAERVETGLRLLREGRAQHLLVSGTHPQVGLGDVARLAAMEPETLAGRVALGHEATSTRGNAAEIAAWARAEGLGSLRIVTAGYHMPRALLELRRALPEVRLYAHPIQPAPLRQAGAAGRLRTWSLLLREYVKYLAALAGFTGPAAPPADGPR